MAARSLFGLAAGGLRLSGGAHFFSDVMFSGVFTFLIVWLMHGLIYRWPRTRITDEQVEAAIERVALPPHLCADAPASGASASRLRGRAFPL